MLKNAKYENRPDGVIIAGGDEIAHTLQCAHCQRHFISMRGSGKLRGFCTKCMAVTCGNANCNECVPFEKKLEAFEKGKITSL